MRNMKLNLGRLLPIKTRFSYEQLPTSSSRFDSQNTSPFSVSSLKKYRWRSPSPVKERLPRIFRLSPYRLTLLAITTLFCLLLVAGGGYKAHKVVQEKKKPPRELYAWEHFPRLNGVYNGIYTLVKPSEYEPDNAYNKTSDKATPTIDIKKPTATAPPLNPVVFSPYPNYTSEEYLLKHHPVKQCYLDAEEKIPAPDSYAYPGLPQHMSKHFFGSYEELGMNADICYDRFTRFAPYGYGYAPADGGLGLGNHSERAGADKVFDLSGKVDYRGMDWGAAQKRCVEKNLIRFEKNETANDTSTGLKPVSRTAFILRTWTGYFYNENQIYSLRALINELSLKSGGEYDVHLLVHVKDNSIPIWASKEAYEKTLQENVPEEFWGISTLWSELQMVLYYPEPFPDNVANIAGSGIHGVYRSAHFPLQWFAQEHPEYDYFWNWEMDSRFTGNFYEFHDRVGKWAKKQPRKGMWERSARFYIPEKHGSWADFTSMVEEETFSSGQKPIWGPVNDFPNTGMLDPPAECKPPTTYLKDNYQWGVGEEADLIVFNPLFDPNNTNWVFRLDVTGYNRSLPVPPRRAAIITMSRLSRRIIDIMHKEVYQMRHTMFPEMWAPSVALHHGLKAVYAPHPIYFDRDWNLDFMDQTFNHPKKDIDSPFGWGEHNLLGSSFYYNSGFSGALWRRFIGQRENNEGGAKQEKAGTGRMCLRSTLHHPIKHERGQVE